MLSLKKFTKNLINSVKLNKRLILKAPSKAGYLSSVSMKKIMKYEKKADKRYNDRFIQFFSYRTHYYWTYWEQISPPGLPITYQWLLGGGGKDCDL